MGLNPAKIKYLKFFLDKWNVTLSKDNRVTIAGNEAINFFESDSKYKDFYFVDKWKEIKF
ncbi:MAG: hypothetical protein MJ048_01695 [Acidaminococcaceae bacterium]|nr:hypothetical protein [Acidaminococcaceae bacterium]